MTKFDIRDRGRFDTCFDDRDVSHRLSIAGSGWTAKTVTASGNTFRSRGEPIFGPFNRILSLPRLTFISGYADGHQFANRVPRLLCYLSRAYDYAALPV